ncbi:hypothetical protein GMORB2_7096 [Geosmithia morbida]|uniref:Uncharacterized protein n=1 Tax=Geosmithia morbida TaxID=1094350 RepID=A0A9P4YXE9_9HYPO|nr:uncharacterized protein GMORB2_7096 [Geosmithia morbida]KAF4122789.1 hypothetical protein GMORB2_7096 [Geosmithia morbida]
MAPAPQRLLWLTIALLVSLVSAASPPTFCKCTCFKNSTIIPLGPETFTNGDQTEDPSSSANNPVAAAERRSSSSLLLDGGDEVPDDYHTPPAAAAAADDADVLQQRQRRLQSLQPRTASTSCSECTRAFCLNQGIDICRGAEEDDVITLCFKRDSNKDKLIVWGFVIGIVGLLGWAAARRFFAWRATQRVPSPSQSNPRYAPVSTDGA